MRRLKAVDWLLIGTSLPILLFGFVMSVVHGVRGDFVQLPFWVASAPDEQSYPLVTISGPDTTGVSVPVGSRVLQMEGNDLRGGSAAGFLSRWSAAANRGARSLPFTIERDGERSDVRVALDPGYLFPGIPWWAPLPMIVSFAGTVLLLLIRAAHWHLARRAYVLGMLAAFCYTPYFQPPTAPQVAIVSNVLGLPLVFGLAFWSGCELIPGARLWGAWQRALTCVLGLLLSASFAAFFWLPDAGLGALLIRSVGLSVMGFLIALLVVLTLAYRRSDALGRRQIKWIVYGNYVGILPSVVSFAVYSLRISPEWTSVLSAIAIIGVVASPLSLLVAIAFCDFLDIDRLFSATLTYSALLIVGLAIVLGIMPTAARAASEAFGLDPASGQLLFSLGVAGILVPAQRLVRPRIDRLLFPERLTLAHGFERLLTDIAGCADAQVLAQLVGERLDALLRPASAVLYARTGNVFTPVAARGRSAPPAFAAHSALIAALQERTSPLVADRWAQRRTTALTPFERAALETLDVAVLVPIRRGTDLVAFACLGPKRSGDIYTPTDLALLGAVAGKISERLLSLDTTAVVAQAHAMQEALRRYVPGAVAQRIVSGQDVEAGEREVSVLFVDIRGYTGFSEQREAEEIFRTVNRYTETVSTLVQANRGVVVEFTGDGMMAVFGAPEDIPMKERAAVQTAHDILEAMAGLAGPNAGAAPALAVGVGIATGPAFVGNIQSADRFIWTVIGNTTNLAARLQSLTRELDAAVAVDDTTFRRAGRACTDFVHHGDLAIRGRTQPESVHTLPLR